MEYEGDLLETLVLPATIAENPYTLTLFAFSGKHNLKNIVFPEIPFSISNYCFSGCSSLETVNIPQQITAIGTGAFNYCPNIKKINYSAENITTSDSAQRFAYAGYLNGEIELFVAKNVKSLPTLFHGSVNSTPSDDSSIKITKVVFEEISVCQNFGSNCFSGVSGPLEVHVTEAAGWLTAIFNNVSANPLSVPNAKLIVTNAVEDRTYLLEELECPTNIFQIKNYVFYGYDYLTKVTIGDHVTSLGSSAFSNCTKLQHVILGEKLVTIGSSAFSDCSRLELVEYRAENVTSTNSAFNANSGHNTNPTKVIIGGNVKRIPNSLFSDMSSLEQVVFEENLNNLQVGNTAFPESSIQKVYVSSLENWLTFTFSNRRANPISNLKAGLYVIEGEEEKLITDITIPQSILSISPYAFFKYKELKTINLHKDVTTIGAEAFIAAPNLENIDIDSENLSFIEEQGMLMPVTKDTIYGTNKNYIGEIELPTELLSVPAYCFYSRTNITKVTIPETVTSIGAYAFYNCSYLTHVNLPENLTTLGDYTFYECTRLEEIQYNCINLGSMYGKTRCFQRAGYINRNSANGLTFIIGSKVEKIADYLFTPYSQNDSYRAYVAKIDGSKNSVCTTIGTQSFYYCYPLKEVSLPQSITLIGSYAFYAAQFSSFPVLNQLATIQAYAFQGCNKLVEIVLARSVTSVETSVFYNCNLLTILAEAIEKPAGWNSAWNNSNRPVVWGYNGIEYQYNFVTNCDIEIDPIVSSTLITLPSMAQEGLYFWGWYLSEDFSGSIYRPNTRTHASYLGVTENIVFYARWEDEPFADGSSMALAIPIAVGDIMSVSMPNQNSKIYFKFVPSTSGTHYWTSQAKTLGDPYGFIYNSSGGSLAANDDGAGDLNFLVSYNMTAGTTYYLVAGLHSNSTSGGAYSVKVYR